MELELVARCISLRELVPNVVLTIHLAIIPTHVSLLYTKPQMAGKTSYITLFVTICHWRDPFRGSNKCNVCRSPFPYFTLELAMAQNTFRSFAVLGAGTLGSPLAQVRSDLTNRSVFHSNVKSPVASRKRGHGRRIHPPLIKASEVPLGYYPCGSRFHGHTSAHRTASVAQLRGGHFGNQP